MKTLLILSTVLSIIPEAPAVTVRFDDIDRAPTANLNIAGVAVGGDSGAWSSTRAGTGLGLAGSARDLQGNGNITYLPALGSDYQVDMMLWYDPTTGFVWYQDYEIIVFTAPGPITGISITPVVNVELPAILRERWSINQSASVNYYPTTMGSATVFVGDESSYLADTWYGMPEDTVWPEPSTLATFTTGFSIVSLDYTPASVPEPGTIALLGIGLLALWQGRKF